MTDPLNQIIDSIKCRTAEKYARTNYTESYVAFLDILGMKNLVKRPYEDLRSVFNAAESAQDFYSQINVPTGGKFIDQNNLKMTIMSDAIVLSIDCQIEQSLPKLIGFSSHLINSFITALDVPVFLRGGITRGEIFQSGNTVFGPGLVEAYTLENEVAKNMRCVISKSLESDPSLSAYLSVPGCALIRDSEDSMYFINFVRRELVERLRSYAEMILTSKAKEEVKEKYSWLCRHLAARENA